MNYISLLLALVIAVITIIEHFMGTPFVLQYCYGSWWFTALWGVVALGGCWSMYKHRMWRRPAVFCLHVSFLVILAGALTTHLTSHRGFIPLREGEATRFYLQKGQEEGILDMKPMPFYLALDSFRIQYDADGQTPKDYLSYVQLSDNDSILKTTISMNNIARTHGYRIYQTSYDEDLHGSLFTVSYDPWGTALTYLGYFLLAVSMVWCGIKPSRPSKKAFADGQDVRKKGRLGSTVLWLVAILLSSYMVIAIAFRPLVPVLRSPMLVIHVSVIMVAYILLIVSIFRRSLLRYAVFFLAAGIFLGAMWANISWGSYWSWDPKESWALVTLLVYSLPLHSASLPWFRSDRHYRLYCILCLLCLLMTYFGVNYLLGGMHSYA